MTVIEMELTKEQYDIINSTGNIKINAVAGSGKTTTVIEYAKTRPATSKILYLAFNKSVKLEAAKKFAEKGLNNVNVETAHSLAYRHIVFKNEYKVRPQGYKTNEIAELLNLQGNGEKHTEYVIANHINKFIAYFCNSNKQKVQDLNYLDTVTDPKAKTFVSSFYDYIVSQSRLLLSKMDKGEIEITHDFYLKKFQLSNPKLNYDFILFDEGQDASPAMLDIFFNQKATKVIVGDTHQQIYGWRFAVNSLEKADFKTYHLSTSFRFSQDIANLAMEVLKFKKHLDEHQSIPIIGKGNSKEIKTKAVLARTNFGLLLKAIEYVTEKKKVKQIYFEGNINSYTYADEGASLYDVLNLYNGKHHLIKDKLIKAMQGLNELEDYIEKTEDVQLAMMVEIVKEYGNKIPDIIKAIKEKHVDNDDKEKAEMIFSTVHRCKGMEYDAIQLVNDFITEEKLAKLKEDKKAEGINTTKLNEEINLLYVAVTRTKNSIHIPEPLMPSEFPKSSQIHVMKVVSEKEKEQQRKEVLKQKTDKTKSKTEKAYSVEEVRAKHKDAYKPWTPELDNELTVMYCEGVNVKDMAKHFGRTRGAITSRIKKLELE
ncbi:UvrD/REP helicase N-terminal domain-containing protein [Algoriphagus ornithinivorans]|uniref:DNA 3'-5' helicase n=1 Tax=Algoriphagus ornithinivorans TaxID=226506 RepID=A0A1I5AFY7_9BACT|nr:UvrD-helicase domain-containing protein [Algoriphagus ornithinivorans]SFN61396.1 UvrD/REP helicase N-terminal domain-containing protein [Algoriphagus ornithinivorans]